MVPHILLSVFGFMKGGKAFDGAVKAEDCLMSRKYGEPDAFYRRVAGWIRVWHEIIIWQAWARKAVALPFLSGRQPPNVIGISWPCETRDT